MKTLTVAGESGVRWKITRDEEWGQWKPVSGGGNLDASTAVSAVNGLSSWTFEDVAMTPAEAGDKPMTVTAETFDRLTYTFRITPRKAGGYLLSGNVEGEPVAQRTPEKDEKPDVKARRDKEYAETLKKLQERIARERALSKWTYVMDAKTIAPLVKERSDLVAVRRRRKNNPMSIRRKRRCGAFFLPA